jgi:hypothetical protein
VWRWGNSRSYFQYHDCSCLPGSQLRHTTYQTSELSKISSVRLPGSQHGGLSQSRACPCRIRVSHRPSTRPTQHHAHRHAICPRDVGAITLSAPIPNSSTLTDPHSVDLLLATTNLLPPALPCYWTPSHAIATAAFPHDEAAAALSSTFASSFSQSLFKHLPFATREHIKPFQTLLPLIKNLTVALDAYRRRASGCGDLAALIATADYSQWHILQMGWQDGGPVVADLWLGEGGAAAAIAKSTSSVRPAAITTALNNPPQPPAASVQAMLLLQILRLTTLIYNDFALFPMSFASRVRFHSAAQLYHLLSDNEEEFRGLQLNPKFELWVYAIGALACAPFHSPWAEPGEPEVGRWFLDGLRVRIDRHCGDDGRNEQRQGHETAWVRRKREKFLGIIRGFLWWEYVMIRPLNDVWAELFPDDVQ